MCNLGPTVRLGDFWWPIITAARASGKWGNSLQTLEEGRLLLSLCNNPFCLRSLGTASLGDGAWIKAKEISWWREKIEELNGGKKLLEKIEGSIVKLYLGNRMKIFLAHSWFCFSSAFILVWTFQRPLFVYFRSFYDSMTNCRYSVN